jgi:metal-responsive CopG/Arc/MetJ family transcriptional regulator
MKLAISIPDDLFESAEQLGRRLGLSRSRLYATALSDYVGKHRGRAVTKRLDAVYATEDSRPAPSVRRAQRRAVGPESW